MKKFYIPILVLIIIFTISGCRGLIPDKLVEGVYSLAERSIIDEKTYADSRMEIIKQAINTKDAERLREIFCNEFTDDEQKFISQTEALFDYFDEEIESFNNETWGMSDWEIFSYYSVKTEANTYYFALYDCVEEYSNPKVNGMNSIRVYNAANTEIYGLGTWNTGWSNKIKAGIYISK